LDKGQRFNFPNNHPLDVTGGARDFLKKADVILALDVPDLYGSLVDINRTTRVSQYITKPSAKIINISLNDMLVRSWSHDYQCLPTVDVPISADTSIAVPELISICRKLYRKNAEKQKAVNARFKKIKSHHDKLRKGWSRDASLKSNSKVISTAFLAQELWETIKKEDWVLTNYNSRGWVRKLWEWTKPYQYLGRSGGGGIGYGLSAAIGGALAYKGTNKTCVNIQSDGDLLMTASALYTAAHHKIPLLIIMHNNQSYYNSEEHGINIAKFRKRPVEPAGIGTRVDNPPVNFKMVAEGFGVYGDGPITRSEDLRPALQKALKIVKEKKMPALVDVVSAPR
jgi:thiamine pyrophosphate-dependent acetolactate synthase large subunit-like protein